MPRKQMPGEPRRLNLKLTEEVRERLNGLQAATGALSATEVICRALAVYDALWKAKRRGERVVIKGRRNEKDLFLL